MSSRIYPKIIEIGRKQKFRSLQYYGKNRKIAREGIRYGELPYDFQAIYQKSVQPDFRPCPKESPTRLKMERIYEEKNGSRRLAKIG
jgi:hypothetical protein